MSSAFGSPGFAIAPMFVAAAGSGMPNVWNAIPVIIAYVVLGVAGALWVGGQLENASLHSSIEDLAGHYNLFVAAAVLVLGIGMALL